MCFKMRQASTRDDTVIRKCGRFLKKICGFFKIFELYLWMTYAPSFARSFHRRNILSIKIWTTHNLAMWLFLDNIIIWAPSILHFKGLGMAWEICNMKWGFAIKVIIKSIQQFMYGLNFYGSDIDTII